MACLCKEMNTQAVWKKSRRLLEITITADLAAAPS